MEAIGSASERMEALEAAGDVWGPLFEKLGALTKLVDGIGEVRRFGLSACDVRQLQSPLLRSIRTSRW